MLSLVQVRSSLLPYPMHYAKAAHRQVQIPLFQEVNLNYTILHQVYSCILLQ